MKISVLNVVGIDVDDNYKWKDTIFLDDKLCSYDEKDYKKCKKFIKIKYSKKLNINGSRQIEENVYACDKFIYDKDKKIKIIKEDDNNFELESNQEVNEWLVIMLQILLLTEGYSFIHAAAVIHEHNESIVMPSWGGVGKTATVSKLINKGYKLLGDDLNILSIDGNIYSFPKKFVLYFYHKELFPKVFKKKNIRCNSSINNLYSKIIPGVKRILRNVPGLLSFARKHNPQSMKVSPYEIFGEDKIGKQGKVKQIVWLERAYGKDYVKNIEREEITSKAVSVTMNEIFNENMNAVLIMCGMNIIKYDEIFKKMYQIYENTFKSGTTKEICVDRNKPVENVADKVIENLEI